MDRIAGCMIGGAVAALAGSALAAAGPAPEPMGVKTDAELAAIPLRAPARIDFATFPARTYGGPIRYPDFGGAQRRYRLYRTAIRRGFAPGVSFAGRYALIFVGCGTGCDNLYLGDIRTGAVYAVPGSGEERSYKDLSYRADSNILKERWPAASSKGKPVYCVTQTYRWTGARFVSLDAAKERTTADELLGADCNFPTNP
jgi:hypothetical protein